MSDSDLVDMLVAFYYNSVHGGDHRLTPVNMSATTPKPIRPIPEAILYNAEYNAP